MRWRAVLVILLLLGLQAGLAGARVLMNPSFEVLGSAGAVFGGWQQFGSVGPSSTAVHGSKAAALYALATGSGYWQQLECAPGESWRIAGYVHVPEAFPLTGSSQAVAKLEWWNASSAMISSESYPVADASTAVGEYLSFQTLSSPAPAGTAAIRLVLVLEQDPSNPPPQVLFDQITCYSTTHPTIDDVQWTDFPGGRSLQFSNRTWRVKGPGFYGPGPNNFSDSDQSVWVDAQSMLHITIRQINGAWNSSEVVLEDTLGYGDYIFTTMGALDQLQHRTVLGLFLWQYNLAGDSWWNPYNEFDIEYSRWGTPGNQIGQFVAQPWDWEGNIYRYDASFGPTEISSHAIRWLPDRVECRAWRGGPAAESPTSLITAWTYTGPHIPRPEQPRVHINLWYFGDPPSATQEVVLTRFSYVPPGGVVAQDDPLAVPPAVTLGQNYPNPFNPSTVIRYSLKSSGAVRLEVYNIKGQKVATLAEGFKQAGDHQLEWDAAGMPSGVYYYTLTTAQGSATRKCVLLK